MRERYPALYWRNSPLSIARHCGSIIIEGKMYILDRSTDELVRKDIYDKADKVAKDKRKEAERKHWEAQRSMFDDEQT